MCKIARPTVDIPSPHDIVREIGVHHDAKADEVFVDLGTLNIALKEPANVRITGVQDTNSMDATFDYQHTCILIAGRNDADHATILDSIQVGDVVIAQIPDSLYEIIHRVKKMEVQNGVRVWTLKGDNNWRADTYRFLDEHIKWLPIGIIY